MSKNPAPWKARVQNERREQAAEMQSHRDRLTPEQQLAVLDARAPGGAKRERARLQAQIDGRKAKKKK